MPRVDFYLHSNPRPDMRLLLACQLADKACRMGLTVYVQSENQEQAERLDDLMWTWKQDSFLPHALAGTETAGDTPVNIGFGPDCDSHANVLINVSNDIPAFYERFERIAEPLDQDAETRRLGRERYKRYRDADCDLQTHDLGSDN